MRLRVLRIIIPGFDVQISHTSELGHVYKPALFGIVDQATAPNHPKLYQARTGNNQLPHQMNRAPIDTAVPRHMKEFEPNDSGSFDSKCTSVSPRDRIAQIADC
jgi:hypothetical protein